MSLRLTIFFLFASLIAAAPQGSPSDTDPDPDPSPTTFFIPTAVTRTTSLSGASSDPTIAAIDPGAYEFIDAQKFFAVSNTCSPKHKQFYKTAYEGAVAIANAGSKWPQYGTDASDLYFGKGSENNGPASTDIPANLKRASEWNTGEWGWDDYIVLECPTDNHNIGNYCGGKIGSDPRPIGCYVNHTTSWWWDKDTVSCCDTFFQSFNIEQQYEHNKGKDEYDLRELQNSGHLLLHEMMHALRLTMNRPRLVDMVFDGSAGRRIYGPKDVARAARIYGITETQRNADSYAQFANAMYWKDRLGKLPQPSLSPSPQYFVDMVSDHENNYVDIVSPDEPFPAANAAIPTTVAPDKLAAALTTDEPSFVTAPPASAAATSAIPPPKCNGLSSKKYIAQSDLSGNIEDYCNQAAKQGSQDPGSGSLGRTFNKGTPEEVAITMSWPPGQPLPKCSAPMTLISTACDGNDPNNPMNWKGGGSVDYGGASYFITPKAARQSVPKEAGGQCSSSGLQFNLWGFGWANEDGGACLKTNFNGCSGSGYSFNYGMGDDGREWTMTGTLGPGQGNCAHDVIATCGGPDIGCG